MMASIAPWWCRGWRNWWKNQKTTLLAEDANGKFQYDDRCHTVRWKGTIRGFDGLHWSAEISWGGGTPFMPPRLYLDGVYSRVHQLRDRSLCLAKPGLADVFEIADWLDKARHWLVRYQNEGWAVDKVAWALVCLHRPDPGYRLHARPKSYVGLPTHWSPGGECGEFNVRLPTDGGGLGVLQCWRSWGQRAWHQAEGVLFRQVEGESLPGFWVREWNMATQRAFDTWFTQTGTRRKQWLFGVSVSTDELVTWDFLLHNDTGRAPKIRPQRRLTSNRLLQLFTASLSDGRVRPIAGLYLSDETTKSRTIASRSSQMDSLVRSATVVLIGQGALGSEVAHLLAKEQVGRFLLIDGDLFLPGNAARHRLDIASVGGNKAEKMREHILRHHPGASVEVIPEMLDEVIHRLNLPERALLVGLTGDLPSERIIADMAAHQHLPCVHAWTECDGRLLRLMRSLPGLDVGLHQLRELPPVHWKAVQLPATNCGELILPGSAINLHAAANRTTRMVLDLLGTPSSSSLPPENHVLFTAEGLGNEQPAIPPELREPYGQLRTRLDGLS